MNRVSNRLSRSALVALLALGGGMAGTGAQATVGYFSNGEGAESKGMVGAGVAADAGVLGMALNPAMGIKIGNGASACLGWFNPSRSTTVDGDMDPMRGGLIPGNYDSDSTSFFIPCGGANWTLNDRSALGFAVYGNGGLNTDYPSNMFAGFANPMDPSTYASTPVGVNLEQLFIQVNYAYQVNDQLALGIAPVFAYQTFEAKGLQPFTQLSTHPDNVTNKGSDSSTGWGVQVGILWEPNSQWDIGLAYRSKMWMSNFDSYKGLFAEQGNFDIPSTVILGAAFTPQSNPDLTITAEWQRIFYGEIDAIANSGMITGMDTMLGADGGAGFGWKDMNVFRLAAIYQANSRWTVRGGVSYNTEFTDNDQVLFNILAPATPQWHASIGATYQVNERWEVTGAYTRAFNGKLSGVSPMNPSMQNTTLQMDQNEVTIGATYRW
jgi:long-chain fatty acid transport protein